MFFHILDVKNFSRKGILRWRLEKKYEVLKKMKMFGSRTRCTVTKLLSPPYPREKRKKAVKLRFKEKAGSDKNEVI